MWKAIVSYLPGWDVMLQAVFVFLIPYGIEKLHAWIRT